MRIVQGVSTPDRMRHMQSTWRWFDRGFEFDFPVEKLGEILERLRGTPCRLEELLRDTRAELLTRRQDESWSIQENVGHLVDLEPLWAARVEDVVGGAEVMRAADLENTATREAAHNTLPLNEILARLRTRRGELVARVEGLDEEDLQRATLHPRLEVPMRVVDLCFFVAEHDDAHLARVRELQRLWE